MIRLGVRVARAQAEEVLAELLELAPGGVEEVALSSGVVEYAVYGAEGELPALPDLRAVAGGALVEIVTTEVGDDWDTRWRAFHRPVRAGGFVVRAPWHAAEGSEDIVIDPGQAFGTGGHATTRLCLEALASLAPGGPLADLGCGSGVLAIAAARAGWGPVAALDFDPLAVDATVQNAEVNGVTLARVARWDLRDAPAPAAPTVVANLLRPLLLALEFVSVPDVVVASGLLASEADEIAAAYLARFGLRESARREAEGWAALTLVR